ncbi:MAG: signal peptide peptidase SppA [Planctomycetota bacterium]|nr:MAG: signal peptide peptidase SppA [Planctomycetota bacterium]
MNPDKFYRHAISVLACILLASSSATAKTTTTQTTQAAKDTSKKLIAVFDMRGILLEAPAEFEFGFDFEPQRTLHDLLLRLNRAKKDDKVKAVVFTFDKPMLGWGQMQEIRNAICELREAGKDVYCYLEDAGAGTYQLASAASHIYMTPISELQLTGLHTELAYFKGLLDKIGIEADVEHMGAYKGSGEPYTRTAPSDEVWEMIQWLMDDLYEQMVETISEGRGIPADEVREIIDEGPYNAQEALKANLIDEIAYVDSFVQTLRKRHGKDVEFIRKYGSKKGQELDFSNMFSFFKTFGMLMGKAKKPRKESIAVVYVEGIILTGKTERGFFGSGGSTGSTTLRRVLDKARKDDSIKAVVLRVDSPGGSAVASDIIWNATRELVEKKPLVVSMGDVAASGGYFVSMGGATIFANPGTITGSIGVITGKLITKELWDWLGVSFHEIIRGRNADLYNSNRRFDEQQRALIRNYAQYVYDEFKNRVVTARKDRLTKEIEDLAQGRVFTGKQAAANGLVDKLGGLHDAIRFAAKQANIKKYEIRLLPEPKNFFDVFLRELSGDSNNDDDADVISSNGHWTLKAPAIQELLPMLKRIDPQRARTILSSLLRIELLGSEKALMILPADIIIR